MQEINRNDPAVRTMESSKQDVPRQLSIVSGASGSGKPQALKCLEDIGGGGGCVDNLPLTLFVKFATCVRNEVETFDILP